jgi:hypothetical protein
MACPRGKEDRNQHLFNSFFLPSFSSRRFADEHVSIHSSGEPTDQR